MKKFFSFLLIFLITFSQSAFVIALPPVIDWEAISRTTIPELIVVNEEMPTVEAGNLVTIPIKIKNSTSHDARDIVITPTVRDSDANFLSFETLSSSYNIQRIGPNRTEILELKILVDSTSPEKVYHVDINFKYSNSFNRVISSSEAILSRAIGFKVINKNTPPRPQVIRIDTKQENINPGEKINFAIAVKNNGTLPAKDIKVSLEGDGIDINKFLVVDGPQNQYLRNLDGNKLTYFSYTLKASDKIVGGVHGIKIKFEYKDSQNQVFEEVYQTTLSVKGAESKNAILSIDNIEHPKHSLGINEDFMISFNLHNIGSSKAHNIKISLETDKEIIPKSASIKTINSLDINKTEKLSFTLGSTSEAATKNYPIAINIEYEEEKNGEKVKQTISQYVGIYIERNDDSNNSVPKIIIDQYNFNPNIVKAGENFDLNVSFLNTNKSKAIQNIKIFLTVDETTEKSGSVFTPVNSSNTFYIDYIAPKDRVEKNIVMYTVPDAQPKTYTIRANFEYEDSTGKEYTATELIGIPVIQQSKLETTEISMPPEGYIGQPIPVSLEFYNMGKVTLSNLMVKVDGNFQVENANYFVGNFDAGSSEFFEAMIIPTEPGMLQGNVIFSYEDSSGEMIEVLKDFSLNIIEMPQETFPPEGFEGIEPGMEEKTGLKKMLPWIIGTFVLAVITFMIIRKKIIKKKGMSLDE